MSNFTLTVHNQPNGAIASNAFEADAGAVWLGAGAGALNGIPLIIGHGYFLKKGDVVELDDAGEKHAVRFDLARIEAPSANPNAAQLDIAAGPVLLRLDQVNFPTGATAYRHVHAGAGFRVLIAGELTVISDDHSEVATPGHAWFEPAHSPVRAVASSTAAMTSFIRFMVLPVAYEGKPSINILSAEDAAKPRLQTTKRHFERVFQVEEG